MMKVTKLLVDKCLIHMNFISFFLFVVPCLKENTEPCFQLTEDIMCLYLRKNSENEHDLPRPCRKSQGGLLGSLFRYNPHPLMS